MIEDRSSWHILFMWSGRMKWREKEERTFGEFLRICSANCKIEPLAGPAKMSAYFQNQILKSGTSIGANVTKAQQAESNRDFLFTNYCQQRGV